MHPASEEIRRRLISRGSAEGVEKTRRYFREPVATYGCSSSDIKAVAEELAHTEEEPRADPHSSRRADRGRRPGGAMGGHSSPLEG